MNYTLGIGIGWIIGHIILIVIMLLVFYIVNHKKIKIYNNFTPLDVLNEDMPEGK